MPNTEDMLDELITSMHAPKSEQYLLRLTATEKECFQNMAERKGTSLAGLIRALLWEEYRKTHVDE